MADKIKVIITNKQKAVKIPTGIRMLVRRCCNAVLKLENFEGPAEISVTFTDNAGIRELNRKFRQIDRETDVLSFPLFDYEGEADEPVLDEIRNNLGDIVISLEKAQAQAEEYGHSYEREVAFLCVHSMLHLLGYDHERSEADDLDMRNRQSEIMKLLGLEVHNA